MENEEASALRLVWENPCRKDMEYNWASEICFAETPWPSSMNHMVKSLV